MTTEAKKTSTRDNHDTEDHPIAKSSELDPPPSKASIVIVHPGGDADANIKITFDEDNDTEYATAADQIAMNMAFAEGATNNLAR